MKSKKILLLIAITLISMAFMACSAKEEVLKVVDESDPLVILTIHTFDGAYGSLPFIPNYGHTFLSIKNISGYGLRVGNYDIEDGEELSVGTWVTNAHNGVWYNLEAIYYDIGKYDTAVTLSKNIGKDSLDKLNEHILNNDRWEFFYNCSAFSLEAWNTVAGENSFNISGLPTPNVIKKEIKNYSTYENAKKLVNYGKAGFVREGEFLVFELEGGAL